MKKIIYSLALLLFSFAVNAQTLNISDADQDQANPLDCNTWGDGSVQNFFDTGGSGASYGPNENETIVICPDPSTGSKVTVAFATNVGYTFDVHGSDSIYVYDGPDTSAPLLGVHNSDTDPNGFTHSASFENNPSGCLTIVFVSDGADEGTGWDANITCGNPPQPYSPTIDAFINGDGYPSTSAMNPADTGYVDICFGDSILLIAGGDFPYSLENAGSGYSQNNDNCTYEWEITDGTSFTGDSLWFTPAARVGYLITLRMTDPINNIRIIQAKVRVSTIPSFAQTTALLDTICLGDTTLLLGGVTNTDTVGVEPTEGSFEIGGTFAGLTYLPDGSGQNYTTGINISGFGPDQTVQSAEDIVQMCVTMEHSYLGDLEMWLECPDGTQAVIFNSNSGGAIAGGFGGGGTYLGEPIDSDIGNPGVGWEYCWSSDPTVATFGDFAAEHGAGNFVNGAMNPDGVYLPEESFDQFIGCPINGEWIITIRDNLGIDDGYIFEWGIYFDPDINPNTEQYTPTIVTEYWTAHEDIIVDTDTLVVVSPANTGDNFFQFNVEDNFGCPYDTLINVYVFPQPTISPNDDICDSTYTLAANNAPRGGTWLVDGPGTVTFSPDEHSLTPDVTFSAIGTYNFTFVDSTCGNYFETVITYQELPNVEVAGVTFCDGLEDQLVAYTPGSNVQYLWNTGDTNDTLVVTSGGTYSVTVTNACGDDMTSAEVIVEPCLVVAPDVMTPNGDGYNDMFVIDGLEAWPNSSLKIFDRWGRLVYGSDNYQNDWAGTKRDTDKLVSSGTYYWVLVREIDEEPTHGYVTVILEKQ